MKYIIKSLHDSPHIKTDWENRIQQTSKTIAELNIKEAKTDSKLGVVMLFNCSVSQPFTIILESFAST